MAHLKYEITPRNAPRFAADIAAAVEEREGIALDYSPESLEVIDQIIESFRVEGVKLDEVDGALFAFGCYVGEVIVRTRGGAWRKASRKEAEEVFGVPLVVQLNADNVVNPIGKVIKRFENGDVDSLPYFYTVCSQPLDSGGSLR